MIEGKMPLWRRILKHKTAYLFILPLMIGVFGFCTIGTERG